MNFSHVRAQDMWGKSAVEMNMERSGASASTPSSHRSHTSTASPTWSHSNGQLDSIDRRALTGLAAADLQHTPPLLSTASSETSTPRLLRSSFLELSYSFNQFTPTPFSQNVFSIFFLLLLLLFLVSSCSCSSCSSSTPPPPAPPPHLSDFAFVPRNHEPSPRQNVSPPTPTRQAYVVAVTAEDFVQRSFVEEFKFLS